MPATAAQKPPASVPVYLREYVTGDGQPRWLMGQRVAGIPRVIDVPASGYDGPRYVVEPDVSEPDGTTTNGVLDALLDDYLALAERLGHPPMEGWF
jgi:hypothetical protein